MVLIQRRLLNRYMVDEWLVKSAHKYNKQSLENKDGYPAFILMPITTLERIINWTFESLPDEILVGIDPNPEIKNPKEIDDVSKEVYEDSKESESVRDGPNEWCTGGVVDGEWVQCRPSCKNCQI